MIMLQKRHIKNDIIFYFLLLQLDKMVGGLGSSKSGRPRYGHGHGGGGMQRPSSVGDFSEVDDDTSNHVLAMPDHEVIEEFERMLVSSFKMFSKKNTILTKSREVLLRKTLFRFKRSTVMSLDLGHSRELGRYIKRYLDLGRLFSGPFI